METVPLSAVIDTAAQFYGVRVAVVMDKSHLSGAVKVRHVVWWIARHKIGLSFLKIGKVFDRDRSTIICGLRTLAPKMELDPEIDRDAEKIFAAAGKLAALRAKGQLARASELIDCEKPTIVIASRLNPKDKPRIPKSRPLARIEPDRFEPGTREWFYVNNERFVKGALAALRAGNGGNDGHA